MKPGDLVKLHCAWDLDASVYIWRNGGDAPNKAVAVITCDEALFVVDVKSNMVSVIAANSGIVGWIYRGNLELV